jgi:phosphate acyltransferase
MSSSETPETSGDRRTVISIDAMGGDGGVEAVIGGMAMSAAKNPDIRYIVHGDKAQLEGPLNKRPELLAITEIRHAESVVSMEDKPSHVVRHGKDTSMWNALETVREGDATVAVSCGNTGALMALSMLRLRKLPGVNRPAIAVLWPSRNATGQSVLLDLGADIRADAGDLLRYAIMGASYARNALDLTTPRIGLLNVGTEEHKGRPELHEAAELIAAAAESNNFTYAGFVEGSDFASPDLDVIVTDGFTGNVALKASEGTALLIREFLYESFRANLFNKFSALVAMPALKRLQKRMDPRRQNGGVFLGLNGTVIKSHGSADETGVSAAIKLAFILAQKGFSAKLAARVASGAPNAKDDNPERNAEAS